jgi:hypothetical protein
MAGVCIEHECKVSCVIFAHGFLQKAGETMPIWGGFPSGSNVTFSYQIVDQGNAGNADSYSFFIKGMS